MSVKFELKYHKMLLKSAQINYTQCHAKVRIMSVKCKHVIGINLCKMSTSSL